jgi:hypothetical protein
MMAYMRFKSKKVVEEVLSLASNKKYIRNGEGGREASRAHYFTIGQRKDSMWEVKIRCLSLRLM